MRENFCEYFKIQLQKFVPFLLSLMFVFLENIEPEFGLKLIQPMLGLSCVFFWSFNRPDIFGVFCAAALGAVSDILEYAPLGLFLFSFVLLQMIEMKIAWYISNKIFVINWATFGVLSLFIVSIQWFLASLSGERFLPFDDTFASWIVTVCLYPLIAAVNLKISNWLMPEDFE